MNALRCFIPLVKFLADSLGEHCEVVLHDVTDVEHSIIAIANNHISGREVDGPLTDLAIRWINEKWHLKTDYLANYAGRTSNGKLTRSSTFFIRDDDGNLAGMLCLNFDVSALSRARDTLDALVRVAPLQEPESDAWSDGVENLTGSVEDLMHATLNDILAHSRVRPNRMTAKEKMDIVRKLKEKGIFLLKSSVSVVASRLESSESTIYRYLSLIEQHERKGN